MLGYEYMDIKNTTTEQLRTLYLEACELKHSANQLYGAYGTRVALLAFAAAGDVVEEYEVELMRRGGFFEWLTEINEQERREKEKGQS
jgi:hypothetical protein